MMESSLPSPWHKKAKWCILEKCWLEVFLVCKWINTITATKLPSYNVFYVAICFPSAALCFAALEIQEPVSTPVTKSRTFIILIYFSHSSVFRSLDQEGSLTLACTCLSEDINTFNVTETFIISDYSGFAIKTIITCLEYAIYNMPGINTENIIPSWYV